MYFALCGSCHWDHAYSFLFPLGIVSLKCWRMGELVYQLLVELLCHLPFASMSVCISHLSLQAIPMPPVSDQPGGHEQPLEELGCWENAVGLARTTERFPSEGRPTPSQSIGEDWMVDLVVLLTRFTVYWMPCLWIQSQLCGACQCWKWVAFISIVKIESLLV